MLEHYRGYEAFVCRIQDLISNSERQGRCMLTPFLTLKQQQIVVSLIGKRLYYRMYGGYRHAQSQRIAISPMEMDYDFEIVCLKATYKNKGTLIRHSDVLGALMNLGMERECFGDIIVDGCDIYLFTYENLCSFVCQSFTQIKTYHVCFEPEDNEIHYQLQLQMKKKSVASMRMDCIVAACMESSRTKAVQMIQSKKVKLDGMVLEDCKTVCHNMGVISIRGFGRYQIHQTNLTSKKGKQFIEIGKYQ